MSRRAAVRKVALVRAARMKRWAVGGAVAVAGFFSAAVAGAQPASHPTEADPPPAWPVTPPADQISDQRVVVLAPPERPPRASTATSGAVSGG